MIALVPLRVSHASVFARESKNPDFMAGLLYDHSLTLEEAKEDIRIKLKKERTKVLIARSVSVDGKIVGRVGATKKDVWYLWYWIARHAQKKGIAREALKQLLPLLPRPIYTYVDDWNIASQKLLGKFPFQLLAHDDGQFMYILEK